MTRMATPFVTSPLIKYFGPYHNAKIGNRIEMNWSWKYEPFGSWTSGTTSEDWTFVTVTLTPSTRGVGLRELNPPGLRTSSMTGGGE